MRRTVCVISLTLLAIAALGADEPTFRPDIPKAWDDKALEGFELPMIPGIYFRGGGSSGQMVQEPAAWRWVPRSVEPASRPVFACGGARCPARIRSLPSR